MKAIQDNSKAVSDADIFYAELLIAARTADGEAGAEELAERWNDLLASEDMDSLFRCLMYIKCAEADDIGHKTDLYSYFNKDRQFFQNWRGIITALEKINSIWCNGYPASASPDSINMSWILEQLSEYDEHFYCHYPIVTFWFKYAEQNNKGEWALPAEKTAELKRLYEETLRYYYLNAVAYNDVAYVKQTTDLVCEAIWRGGDYIALYADNAGKAEEMRNLFAENIRHYHYGKAATGLMCLLDFLNPQQDQKALSKAYFDDGGEYILPDGGWENYDGWTEEQYNKALDTLGNYTALEEATNIYGGNWFSRKKKKYAKSAYQDARDLCELEDWTYAEWEKREKQCEDRLFKFFGIKPKAETTAE